MTVTGGRTLAADLRRLLPATQVLDGPGERQAYAYDASFLTQLAPAPPDAVVLARRVEDVQTVLRYASERGVPVAPRGAASGMMGGSTAPGGIVLALNAMDRLLEVDVPNGQAFCEPGLVHAALNARLAPHRLAFPPDPGSSRMATVGGMASTNAHGMRAVKYGPTGAWVLGLDVVLADGQVIETGSVGSRARQSTSGLDLTRLFVGSEGILGVITRLRLKLMPVPPARAMVLALFDVLERAGEAVQRVLALGVQPSAMEILDARTIQAVNLYRPALRLPPVEALLLFEVDGNPPGVRWDAEQVTASVADLAVHVEWSDEPARLAELWEARSLVGAAVGMLRPGATRAYCGEDICVPVARVPEALRRVQALGAEHDVVVATYGHIGGGGLHPALLLDRRQPDGVARVLAVADAIHRLALDLGGTVTGEHGVGVARSPYMAREHGPALDTMCQLKAALDPRGILSPGTLFPDERRLRLPQPLAVAPGVPPARVLAEPD